MYICLFVGLCTYAHLHFTLNTFYLLVFSSLTLLLFISVLAAVVFIVVHIIYISEAKHSISSNDVALR